jgi:hypothetical protein
MARVDRESDDVNAANSAGAVPDAGRWTDLHGGAAPTSPGAPGPAATPGADFVWRFRIDEKPAKAMLKHPLDELLRVQWEELLKLCVPTFQGRPVKVDGFATMREPQRILPIFADESQLAVERSAEDDKAQGR